MKPLYDSIWKNASLYTKALGKDVKLVSPFEEVNGFLEHFKPQYIYELKGETGSGKSLFISKLLKSNQECKILLIDPLSNHRITNEKNIIHKTNIFYFNELRNELQKYVNIFIKARNLDL
jgi:hypothetical protein